jgi:hypothetical protein
MLALVDAPEPPARMPFGSEAAARIEAKNVSVAEELARWRGLSLSTDFGEPGRFSDEVASCDKGDRLAMTEGLVDEVAKISADRTNKVRPMPAALQIG